MEHNKRPKIAITKPDGKEFLSYLCVAIAVRLAGGRPFPLTAETIDDETTFDGIVVGGGQDVFPMLYDDTPKHGYAYDQPRDAMDIKLVARARQENIPMLGICRGAQLMNVARGGSLHLDTSAAYENANYPDSLWAKIFFRKKIVTEPGSIIRQSIGERVASVNSLHKQAAKTLGHGLTATAREENGVVQAIEDPQMTFFLGVQFHPEFLIHRSQFRRIFSFLVESARRNVVAHVHQSRDRVEMAT